ncbi:hypothetical protein HOY82DRAFT_482471, partial [Tuber indicum]
SEQIYRSLESGDLIRLARVNTALYSTVQGPLYRNATVTSYNRLALFVRTLHNVVCIDTCSGKAITKPLVTLRLTIDPCTKHSPTAAMLANMIGALKWYYPNVSITLRIPIEYCNSQTLWILGTEEFPRVTTLILELGGSSISSSCGSLCPARNPIIQAILNNPSALESCGCSDSECIPNSIFWSRIFNGFSFPDLQEVEVLHKQVTLDSQSANPVVFSESCLKRLGKITRLMVDSAPELSDSVLMGSLTRAECLKRLELRNIFGLSYEGLSILLPLVLPNLTHFTLEIPFHHPSAQQARDQLQSYQSLEPKGDECASPVHLCPLLRVYGKHLHYLEVHAPYLCRDLFLHESEKYQLDDDGVMTDIGGASGGVCFSRNGTPFLIDRIALEQTIRRVRKHKGEKAFQDAVQVGSTVQLSVGDPGGTISAGARDAPQYHQYPTDVGGLSTINKYSRGRLMMFREGMCRDGESWEEIGELARLEEANVRWTCISG